MRLRNEKPFVYVRVWTGFKFRTPNFFPQNIYASNHANPSYSLTHCLGSIFCRERISQYVPSYPST